ncbi:hypothetical protein [Mycobacterium canetti]|uniref:Uncharacterized protein n=1 Tax=Mycobacterium canetti TaxID=78331 RepID=A0ABV1MHU2_9MYCO|nr:hypothetical protein [Mycobacterium canetti]
MAAKVRETPCAARRCAYGTQCTCEHYRDWPIDPPRIRPWLGRRAEAFRWGHRTGRRDACRRLWQHLDAAGRQLAAAIADEGSDDD